MKTIDIIAAVLLVIGGLNWGLVGLSDINIIDAIFSHAYVLARIVYVVVGLAAVWNIFQWKAMRKRWR